jgi:hypothetical protein
MKKVLLALSLVMSSVVFAGPYDKPGFVTYEKDGRIWVFKVGSKGEEEFKKHGEVTKQYSMIGHGPKGMTLKSDDQKTLDEYIAVMDK